MSQTSSSASGRLKRLSSTFSEFPKEVSQKIIIYGRSGPQASHVFQSAESAPEPTENSIYRLAGALATSKISLTSPADM